jgi:4-amino-4-deoxy-L-arabinose transferase-like glycosyltransferase
VPEPSPISRASARSRLALLAILALSFVVRVVYVVQSRHSPAFEQPSMDALYHLDWARAFAAGKDFQPGPFFRAPLYPWFLGILLRLFGEDLLAVRLVQAAIGTASVGLVYLVGARAFDVRTGLLGALFAGLYWVTIYFEGELLLPVLEVFFDLLAIWLALRVEEEPAPLRPLRIALCGAAFGVAALVRPNVLLFCPFVALWILLRAARRGTPKPLVAAAVFLAALAAPIAPVTLYNGMVGKDWVLVSSQGGVNFWIGNNPRSNGVSAVVPGTRQDWWGGYRDSIRMAELEEGRPLKPSEVSRHYAAKAWSWIRSEPRAALRHTLWKLRLFWTDFEFGNNASERFFAFRFGPILRALPLGFVALAPLALLGFLLAARNWRHLFPLWGFLPVYTFSVVAFFVCARFRVPVLPAMALFAAHACWRLFAMARDRALLPLAASGAFLAAAILLVESVPAAVDRSDSLGEWELGIAAAQRGEIESAVEHYRQSIARNAHNSRVQADLGDALRRLGRTREAEESLRTAVAIDPGDVVALSTLTDLLVSEGRPEEARGLAERAARISPVYAPARYDLGRIAFLDAEDLKRSGAAPETVRARLAEGLRALEQGLALADDDGTTFDCAYAAGRIQLELGHAGDAALSFASALAARTEPPAAPEEAAWWWQCQQDLLDALRGAGRGDEAERRKSEIQRRRPMDPRATGLR